MVKIVSAVLPINSVFPKQLSGDAARVLHIERQLKSFERLTTDEQERLLSAQLKNLLLHARKFSPYWKQKIGSVASEKKSPLDQLLSLPVLSRADLQSHFDKIIAHFPGKKRMHTSRSSTSGSTGTPVNTEQLVEIHNPLQSATMLLTARWHKIDPKKPLGTLLSKVKDNDYVPLGTPFRWFSPVAVGFSCCLKGREYSELYEYCSKRQPAYLITGPTALYKMARYAIDNGRNDLQIEAALSLGSAVTEEIRETVKMGLGAKIIDRYSSEELGTIAIQCPTHDHLHVISPLTLVEILNEFGRPCSIGEPGRVLITNLHSYGMPLIRYDIGDYAEWGEPCDCGATLPVIRKLWGRVRHMIRHPNGRETYARIYARDFEGLNDLEEYRFVLHKNEVIVAYLKVRKQSSDLARTVTETIQTAVGYPYEVRILYVDNIDWGRSWKKEPFAVSDSPSPNTPPVT